MLRIHDVALVLVREVAPIAVVAAGRHPAQLRAHQHPGGVPLLLALLAAGLGTALADGNITADEIALLALRGEVAALQSTLAGIDRALEEIERQTTLPRTLGGK